jgi:RNA polymerase sigma factor (sigma-70 family)
MSELSLDPPHTVPLPLGRSDARIARRAAAGDEKAFGAIYDRYHQPLYRYCLSILRDPDDALDALQNTMLSALRGLPGQREPAALKSWLFRIAHNESISLMRRRAPADHLGSETVASLAAAGGGAEQRAELAALVDDLRDLPERQRHALVLRELVGLSHAEIGAAIGVTEPGARQAVYEAREGLRTLGAGRVMSCEAIREAISDGDGRRRRSRMVRAHLKDCEECRAYADAIDKRRTQLAILAPPLPAILATGLLAKVLGTVGGGGGAGGAGGVLVGARQRGRGLALAGGTAAVLAVVGGALALSNSSDKTTPTAVKVAQIAPPKAKATPKPPAQRPPPSKSKATDHPASLAGYGGPGGTTLAAVDQGKATTDPGPAPTQLLAATTTPGQPQSAAGAHSSGRGTGLPMTGTDAWLTGLLGSGLLSVGGGLRLLRRRPS